MKTGMFIALAVAVSTITMGPAYAFEAGDWTFKTGLTNVDPKQSNGSLEGVGGAQVVVDDDTAVTLTGAYFLSPKFSIELLASTPFEHDLTIGGVAGGSTQHLPPMLSAQYHFNADGEVIPYVGLGVNYTIFFSTKAYGACEGLDFSLDNSFGLAAQAGIDYMISDQLFANVDLRYISIETDVKVNGTDVGTVKIDPMTVGLNIGYRF